MNLLNVITPIINSKTAKVTFEVSANPRVEGELIVVAYPITGPVSDKASEELKHLSAALATPIKVIGTPDDIEQALADAVNEQVATRTSWAARAASLEAKIDNAAQADAKTSKPATKPAPETSAPEASATPASTDSDANDGLEL